MILRSRWVQLGLAAALGVVVLLLPRPEGSVFEVAGDPERRLGAAVEGDFGVEEPRAGAAGTYRLVARDPGRPEASSGRLRSEAERLDLERATVGHVDGLSPRAQRFLALLVCLVVLFVLEPIPLEITAILIGVLLVLMDVVEVKDAWAPYMHPVVVFIMCCLIFAIALSKAGLTKRLGQALARRANGSVTRFTYIVAVGLGMASAFMHDAAATAVGISVMLPLMRAAGIEPHTKTARFMMLSLPFACSCGGMGSLVGGGRCMVAAAFLKEFTGVEISFLDWIVFAMPMAIVTVPVAVTVVYLVYRPDPSIRLPRYDMAPGPWSEEEKRTAWICLGVLALWLTKNLHGIDYSITGMLGVTALVLAGILKWDDIHAKLEWGTALFIFGGGIALGLAMGTSGAASYFANLFFPLVHGMGWLVLFVGLAVFGALVTNVMANVAAAALVLPIVIPLAELENVDPRVLALCLGMATSFAMLLVIGCPPNAIAYSYRQFKSRDLTKVGLVAMPILLAVLVGMAVVWWGLLGLV